MNTGKTTPTSSRFLSLLKKNDPEQLCYYDPGVGTGGRDYERKWLRKKKDQAAGSGLQENINDAYKFLMRRYEEGDKIYLFGFSRGAFTVRSLAGMLHKCGLLRTRLDNMVPYAAKMYNKAGNDEIAERFKNTFSIPCPVHFIGVWDTVKSLFLNAGGRFHDASLNDEVAYGFHAVALDEKREGFPPSLWDTRDGVEQVWFAGVHADVGGWYDDASLSDIALRWMADKAMEKGLLLDKTAVNQITGDPLGQAHDSFSGKDLKIWERIRWRFLGKEIRDVPDGALIHESVQTRINAGIEPLPPIPENAKFVS